MQRYRATSGPFEYVLRFSHEEIDQMCLEALEKAGCLPTSPEPIRIDRFIEKHFTANIIYEDLGLGVLGYTAFEKDGRISAVGINSRLEDGREASERRLRSTLAHEGGHCLLHPCIFMQTESQVHFDTSGSVNVSLKDRRFLCRPGDIDPAAASRPTRPYEGLWWEWQANRAIGGFLLPKNLVLIALAPFVNRALVTGSPSLPASAREAASRSLAGIFEVNPVVARIRISEMFPDVTGRQMEF
jgi:hypothetical protein